MQAPPSRHSFVNINSTFIHLLQYGFGESLVKPSATIATERSASAISDLQSSTTLTSSSTFGDTSARDNAGKKCIVVFLPGNPGVLGIYHDFLLALFKTLRKSSDKSGSVTILAIGHNNFDHPDHVEYRAAERLCVEEKDLNFVERSIAKSYEPHHIELQVINKIIILKRLLKVNLDDCRLIFVGHSIGCYIILRLLQDKAIAAAHAGSVLIHPAIENLALTEKGARYNTYFNYHLDLIAKAVAFVLDKLLPKSARFTLTKWLCSPDFVQASSDIVIESMAQLICPSTLNALIEMAKSEFASIKSINHNSMIRPHVSKLKLVYAINDHWVNANNRRELRELYPNIYMEEQSTLHAFVMDPKGVMDYSIKVGMFIQDFIDSQSDDPAQF